MNQTFKLYRLQQIDSQLDRAHARLQEIKAALDEHEALRQAEQRAKEASDRLQAEQKLLRRAEENAQEQRVKIEQTEATLYSGKVRNPKELQDLQNESAALKRYRSVLEDRQLEAMITVEEAEAVQQAALNELEAVRAQYERQRSELTNEQTGLLKDVSRMESEREAATSSLSTEELSLYNQLRQQRRGIAVAKVTDNACSACGSTLNATLLNAARSPNQITRCSSCGRILYAL
jgi:predicted  nucleic acid-binding Zn-ribbon protein